MTHRGPLPRLRYKSFEPCPRRARWGRVRAAMGPDQGLLNLLTQQWRSYLAFVLSFMLVGINWANHRVMFATFARANHALVWLNLLYLMLGVAFMPVPTAVLGAWLGSPNNQVVAAVFYGGAATVGGLVYNLLWWYPAYAAKLTSPAPRPPQPPPPPLPRGPAPLRARDP